MSGVRWFFNFDSRRRRVEAIARFEDIDTGTIADARDVFDATSRLVGFPGITYRECARRRSGSFLVGEDGVAVFDEPSL